MYIGLIERISRLNKITKKYFKNFNSILEHKHFTKSRFVNLKLLHEKEQRTRRIMQLPYKY